MKDFTRMAVGLSTAPLAAVTLIWVVLIGFDPFGMGRASPREAVYAWAALLLWVLPVGYLAEVFVGMPLHGELQRRGNSTLGAYLAVGAVAGMAPFAAYALLPLLAVGRNARFRIPGEWPSALIWAGIGSACGSASAALFWIVAIRGRKTVQPPGESLEATSKANPARRK